ncbi:MAG: Tetratricopeptide 2 repeat protein [Phycisphaerales bacterium]|nr:Tetratricopeptide 2 repeat protein [Phycisphaerales bacterium]
MTTLPGQFTSIIALALTVAATARAADPPAPPLTFTRDIAPLVYRHCAGCHAPGGVGPFDLLTYDDVRRHARQIVKVVTARAMPPWLPEPGFGEFAGNRRLDDATIATFQGWVEQNTPEGNPADLPKPPRPPTEWELGKPDLVIKLPKPYTLAAEGTDLYRNFVLPTGLDSRRFVRAVELHSGNARVVHHAFLFTTQTSAARRRAAKAGDWGFDAMNPGDDAYTPDGENITWQPGRAPCLRTEESPWLLPADADVILQAHLRRQGKPETLQPELGFYFTDKPPTGLQFKLMLRSTSIDIPAGASDYAITSAYTLPVDVDAVEIAAHAHYLGKDLQGFATLPDGTRRELLRIKHWNFNMQDSYTFKEPLHLPRGTRIQMRFEYDNSDRNPMNPSTPPKRVLYGDTSSDEMGELILRLRVRDRADRGLLNQDYTQKWLWPDAVERLQNRLKLNPQDANDHVELAKLFLAAGRRADVAKELNAAFKIDPALPQGHFVLAHMLVQQGDYPHAAERFRKCLEGDPDNFRARADLALALGIMGKLPESVEQFLAALQLNPRDSLTHANLGRIYALQGNIEKAKAQLEEALRLDPDQAIAREAIKELPAPKKP